MLSENRVARYSTRHSRSGWLDRMVFQMHWDLDFTGVSFTEFLDMGFPWLLLAFNTKLECTQLSFHLCIFTRRGFAVYLCHTAPISFIYAILLPFHLFMHLTLHLILVSCTFSLMTLHVCMFLVNYSRTGFSSIYIQETETRSITFRMIYISNYVIFVYL
jgi:hypothetical protein